MILGGSFKSYADVAPTSIVSKPAKEKTIRWAHKFNLKKALVVIVWVKYLYVMAMGSILGRPTSFMIVGWINKLFKNRPLVGTFLLFPAKERFRKAYVPKWYAESMRWVPRLVGIARQNKKWILIFGVSSTNADFRNEQNVPQMRELVKWFKQMDEVLGTEQSTFAGILPGLLCKRGIVDDPVEGRTTVHAVNLAKDEVIEAESLPPDVPIVVLGGNGYIGLAFRQKLAEIGDTRKVYSIDPAGGQNSPEEIARELHGQSMILLNIATDGAIARNEKLLWPGVVVLNEVYPAPKEAEIAMIREHGAVVYHIVGAKGWAFPPFPAEYKGAIPCCCSYIPDQPGQEYEAVIRKLVA